MKRIHKKQAIVLLACLILVLTVSAGTTLSYLLSATEPVTDTFEAAEVACEVSENYSVKNTGDVAVYLRVKILVSWVNTDGTVCAQVPVNGTDYSFHIMGDWVLAADGYYYCTQPVAPGTDIPMLDQILALTESDYTLSVRLLASAVQANPTTAVAEAWKSGVASVSESGELSILGPAQE